MSLYFKLEFYVPVDHLETVKTAVFATGAGKLGNYDRCCWQTQGTGQFCPHEGSNPFLGEKHQVEVVQEYKVEMVCHQDCIKQAIAALKKHHPYETPAYSYWKIQI